MSRKLSTADFMGVVGGGAEVVYGDLGLPMDVEDWSVISGAGATVSQIEEDTLLFTMTGGTGGQPTVGVFVDGSVQIGDEFSYDKRVSLVHSWNNFQSGGLMVRDSLSGELLVIYKLYNSYSGGWTLRADKWTSGTASTQVAAVNTVVMPDYFRVRSDGTTIYLEYSFGGKIWTTLYQVGRTSALANAPDQVGAFVQPWYESGTARNPRVVIRSMPKAQLVPTVGARILASGRVDCTDPASPVLVDGINVASVTKTATGMYRVTFENEIDPTIAGFGGNGHWANGFSATALMLLGVERADGRGLDAAGVDISTATTAPAGQLFDCDDWFSFEVYDVTQQGGGGTSGGGVAPILTMTPPKAADFPMSVNEDTLILIDRDYALIVDQPGALGFEARGFFQDAPATPWTVYAKMDLSLVEHGNNCRIGIGVRNATSEKLTCFGVYTGSSGSRAVGVTQWNNPTGYQGEGGGATYGALEPWFKLENDGTDLKFYWGDERGEWMLVKTLSLASFMVSVDEVGIIMQANNISKLSVLSWGFDDPAGA